MKYLQLVFPVLALQLDLSWSFESNRRFPMMPRWGRTIQQAQVSPSREPEPDPDHTVDEESRRNLILGSAAVLTSALMGAPTPSKAATVILEESESRRINIFDRTAPSVVFIDTFTEKQDAFSPNIMEVPLGSGSGFVWDKEGHIGTCPFLSRFHNVDNVLMQRRRSFLSLLHPNNSYKLSRRS
jgi:hypothetical protein